MSAASVARRADSHPTLMVVIGSARPGRVGAPLGGWFADEVRRHGHFTVDLVDLGELHLPYNAEHEKPETRRYEHPATRAWSTRVTAADAIVLIAAEYNHSIPGALKNALDLLYHEWADKPVGFVVYGESSSGARAVTALLPVTTCLHMLSVSRSVAVSLHDVVLDGVVTPTARMGERAQAMLDRLAALAELLRPLRYPAASPVT